MNKKNKNIKKYDDGSLVDGPPVTKVPAKQWLADYMSSPIYKQRLNKSGDPEPSIQRMLNTPITFNNNQPTQYSVDTKNNKSYSININRNQNKGIKDNPDDILVHELSHESRTIGPGDQIFIGALNHNPLSKVLLNQYKQEGYKGDYSNVLNGSDGSQDAFHDVRPYENKADLDALRYMMYKKGIYDTSKRDMTLDDFNKASKDKDIKNSMMFNRLINQFKPKDLILMNNTIASNNIPNENTNEIQQAKFGGIVDDPEIKKTRIRNYEDGDLINNGPPLKRPVMQRSAIPIPLIPNDYQVVHMPPKQLTRDQQVKLTGNNNLPYSTDDVYKQIDKLSNFNDSLGESYATNPKYIKVKDSKFNLRDNEKVNTKMLDDIIRASVRNKIDPYTTLSIAQRESGIGGSTAFTQPSTKTTIKGKTTDPEQVFSNWDQRLTVDNKTRFVNDIARKNYQESGLSIPVRNFNNFKNTIDNITSAPFQGEMNTIKKLTNNDNNIQGYNPGDPNYPALVDKEKQILMSPENVPFRHYVDSVVNVAKQEQSKMVNGGNIMKTKIRKYNNGFFVDDNGDINKGAINSAAAGTQYLAAGVNMLQPVNGDSNAGLGAVSGALSGAGTGAKLGAAFGPEGAIIGGGIGLVGGAISGLISGNKKHAAYERQQKAITANDHFNTVANMTTTNVDPYGNQMEFGDLVPLIEDDDPKTKKAKQVAKLQPTYDPTLLNPVTQHFMTSPDGKLKYWGNDIIPQPETDFIAPQVLSDKALGYSNNYYPSRGQQQGKTPDTIHSNRYEDGSDIHIKKSHEGRFTAYKERTGKTTEEALHSSDPHVRQMANFAENEKSWKHENGDTVQDNTNTNTQQNQINIQRGELLINPNDGKILQDYKGINPLTGGLFEPHAKDQSKESPNNFTLADPGLFVITKKTAKQYKDAVDNNDRISQQTVLMNIRNAKIQKEGGLKPKNYAYGDTVRGEYIDPGQVTSTYSTPQIQSQQLSNVDPYLNHQSTLINQMPNIRKDSNFSDDIDDLSKYAPSLLNIGQGLFGKVNIQPQGTNIANPYLNNIIGNMPKDIRGDSIVNEAYSSANSAVKDISNNTSNAGVYRANRQNILSNTQKNVAGIRENIARENSGIAGQRAGLYAGLGNQDINQKENLRNYNYGVTQNNYQAQAAKQNLLNTGISQLQQTQMNDKTNATRARLDQYQIDLLKQIYPSINPYDLLSSGYVNRIKQG